MCVCVCVVFFVQAEDGIRDLVRFRGLGDVYKRQGQDFVRATGETARAKAIEALNRFVSESRDEQNLHLSLIHI